MQSNPLRNKSLVWDRARHLDNGYLIYRSRQKFSVENNSKRKTLRTHRIGR